MKLALSCTTFCAALFASLYFNCGGPVEIVKEPPRELRCVCDGGRAEDVAAPAQGLGADPPASSVAQYGSLLIVLKVAGGDEHVLICGGEVSASSEEGRTLLKLPRKP